MYTHIEYIYMYLNMKDERSLWKIEKSINKTIKQRKLRESFDILYIYPVWILLHLADIISP